VDGRATFSSDTDREAYLKLIRENLVDTEVRILGWCLMRNHVHLVAIPRRPDSLAVLLRRAQGRYAQYFNVLHGRLGHLWQNRYFACSLGDRHLWKALAYVDRNPVRAGLVPKPEDYRWSSAAAHETGIDEFGIIDMSWWDDQRRQPEWPTLLPANDPGVDEELARCTYAGRPFGDPSFVTAVASLSGRRWKPVRANAAGALMAVKWEVALEGDTPG